MATGSYLDPETGNYDKAFRWEWPDWDSPRIIGDPRYYIKKSLPPDVHLPNSGEAKKLRQIMAETGLTEEQIRKVKKYRQQLAKAANVNPKPRMHPLDRKWKNIVSTFTRKHNLAPGHPTIIAELRQWVDTYSPNDADFMPRINALESANKKK